MTELTVLYRFAKSTAASAGFFYLVVPKPCQRGSRLKHLQAKNCDSMAEMGSKLV
jgi:hypothetical protein